ncbi:cobalamin-dependent protein [Streptomyces sp. NPDC000594]|uniref:cobalamin B12-binding domain-containing protein n=1 Tax=Streptomyces sp. NPDC000594 TaxID=3154261 RepID=UPI003320EFCF
MSTSRRQKRSRGAADRRAPAPHAPGRHRSTEPGSRPGPLPTGQRVLVSSVSSDAHTWNLVFLQLLLEELGHRVTNLGCCVPDELLVDTCRRTTPELLVISSVNGHGARDGARVVRLLRAQPDLGGLRVVIGGKLGTSGAAPGTYEPELLAAGFDAVFEDAAGVAAFRRYLARGGAEGRTPGTAPAVPAISAASAASAGPTAPTASAVPVVRASRASRASLGAELR